MTKQRPAEEGARIVNDHAHAEISGAAPLKPAGKIVADDGHGQFHQVTPLGDGELIVELPAAAVPPAARIEISGAAQSAKQRTPGSSAAAYGDNFETRVTEGATTMSDTNKSGDKKPAMTDQQIEETNAAIRADMAILRGNHEFARPVSPGGEEPPHLSRNFADRQAKPADTHAQDERNQPGRPGTGHEL